MNQEDTNTPRPRPDLARVAMLAHLLRQAALALEDLLERAGAELDPLLRRSVEETSLRIGAAQIDAAAALRVPTAANVPQKGQGR